MMSKYLIPLLSILGFLFASYAVVSGNKPVPSAEPAVEPASAPFKYFIAGVGIVEAKSRNIEIGTPVSDIVTRLPVKVGDKVRAGAVLFALDDREPKARLAIREADLAKARAEVRVAGASVRESRSLNAIAQAVTDRRAISEEELVRRSNALAIARSRLASAEAQVRQAEAAVADVRTALDRLVVKAPLAGQILQVNIRPGEFAAAGASAEPPVVLGNLDDLHVRVDIDENDAWRFDPGSSAVAYLRGNRRFKTDLTLAYVEPFVVPKRSLTGDSTERVDTRVLQVLYSFPSTRLPVYIGQQMDVFIEARDYEEPVPENPGAAAAKTGP